MQYNFEKIYPIIDTEREKGKLLLEKVEKELFNLLTDNIEKADLILVGGWDGYFMKQIKKYLKYNKPFYWINCWTVWFLLNPFEDYKYLKNKTVDIIQELTLSAEVIKNNRKVVNVDAVNDLVIGNTIFDYIDFRFFDKNYKWTGLVLTTNIGSTAYWKALWWNIIPLSSNIIWLAGIWIQNFKRRVLPKLDFEIEVSSRNKVNVAVDGIWTFISDVSKIKVKSNSKKYKLAFKNVKEFELKRFELN